MPRGGEDSSGRVKLGEENANALILMTVDFVCRLLPLWRDHPGRPFEESEPALNPQLCKFLDSRARSDFPMVRFDREEPQATRRTVDLAASLAEAGIIEARSYANTDSIYEPIIVFECKRLPAPSRDREREYVTGGEDRSGGIQRFKLGLHGGKTNFANMIGHVQGRALRDWHDEINTWILDLASGDAEDVCRWDDDEVLGPLEEHSELGVSNCKSSHGRIGFVTGESIILVHLWILMNTSGFR